MRFSRFILLLLMLVVFFQVSSLMAPHREGDEMVFLALSQNMSWGLSDYTVMDIEPLNQFANRLYRAPIFMHPPLFPLILKLGGVFANTIVFGVIFNGLMKLWLAIVIYWVALELQFHERAAQAASIMVIACPVLGFVGSRVLADSVFVALLWTSILYLLRALHQKSDAALLLSALVFAFFLNTKFQAVLILPGYLMSWVLVGFWISRRRASFQSLVPITLIASVILIGFGMVHYFRLFNAFGIEGTRDLMVVERPINDFIRRVGSRQLLPMTVYLLLIFPLFIILVIPRVWSGFLQQLRNSREQQQGWMVAALPISFTMGLVSVWFFQQERYWAPVIPMGFLLVARMLVPLRDASNTFRALLIPGFIGILFIGNFMTNVLTPGSMTAVVSPVLFRFFPFLVREGGPFFGF